VAGGHNELPEMAVCVRLAAKTLREAWARAASRGRRPRRLPVAGSREEAEVIEIGSDFPGGNVILDGIEGDTVHVRQDQRDTHEYTWFYWYFAVRGAAGRTLHFAFPEEVVGVRGPGVSRDGGTTWQWLGTQAGDRKSFTYSFPRDAGEVRFSFGMPYTQVHLDYFLADHADTVRLKRVVLCHSRKGRPVEVLHCGRLDGGAAHRVLLTARHHCCEMMASYVLEGTLAAALAGGETGRWLRGNVEIIAIPFVDKDGVEDGDQGKGRDPHDHNRDYAAGLYPEVRALKQWARGSDGLRFALDLHCPWIRGPHNEEIYFVGVPELDQWAEAEALSAVLERVRRGPLPYRTRDNLPFGQDWNVEDGPSEAEPAAFARWMGALPGVSFGTTIEIPYANVHGAEVNAESARAFGRDLAEAVHCYLKESST
jgi:hypothetical protein